ncbi:MAG: N-acetylmuramoyl-L-alanine amidase [Bryobacteraceae bacterium]|nr:N-acetylmuramoyl-L-alanine amidase [Bryobacteraceae bacterium]
MSTNANLSIDRVSRRLAANQFFPEKQAKDLVVLHFTAGGSVAGAYQSWISTRERVATAYLVDLDGRIYETFDPSQWAYHLGVAAAHNPAWRQDRRSIGIEVVNWGGLKPGPIGSLCSWPNQYRNPYCLLTEENKYVRKSFRGLDYFAAFPEAQTEAVCRLTRQLCDQFGIPKQIPEAGRRENLDWPYYENYRGVASHQNFHAEKTDIGPAFDWERLSRTLVEHD